MKTAFWTGLVTLAAMPLVAAAQGIDSAAPVVPYQPAGQGSAPGMIEIGSSAPKLTISKWVKGDPVVFEPGKVYVVEFWATWCDPCRRAIPHLTELQQTLGDQGLTILGIASQEHKGVADLEEFVSRQGDRLGYTVAWYNEGRTDRDWMGAAKAEGIPTAFVIDQKGRVAWIGHPAAGLDRVIEQVLDGTFDINVEAVLARRTREIREKTKPLASAFAEARRANDYDKALSVVDEILRLDPKINGEWSIAKFELLAIDMKDPERAYTFAWQSVESNLNANADDLLNISWFILDEPELGRRDYKLAKRAARLAFEQGGEQSPVVQMVLARALFADGDREGAVRHQERAVALTEPGPEQDAQRKRLDEYKRRADERP